MTFIYPRICAYAKILNKEISDSDVARKTYIFGRIKEFVRRKTIYIYIVTFEDDAMKFSRAQRRAHWNLIKLLLLRKVLRTFFFFFLSFFFAAAWKISR